MSTRSAEPAEPTGSATPSPALRPAVARAPSGSGLRELLTAQAAVVTADPRVPAVVVSAIRPGAAAVHCAGVLTLGGHTAPDPATRFQLGSLTKVFTALLFAELVACGEVAEADPIEAYLPAGAAPRRRSEPPITLFDLATHTSGLPRQPRGFYRNAATRVHSDPYARYGEAELYRATARLRPRGTPSAVRYSTFGMGLLGLLLARAAQAEYGELLAARVLRPLGLGGTGTGDFDATMANRASGHRRGRTVPDWHFQALAPAGALHSCGADMLTFLRAQLNPRDTPLADALRATQRPRHALPNGTEPVCLGWHHQVGRRGRTVLSHTGGTGGFASYLAVCPDAGSGVAVLANATPTRGQPVVGAGRRIMRELLRPATD
ncbi:serine hydrolase domain-containing protein [Saccharothrix sp. ST-888]|uniref:serine hydrolase domain-containing protein n=1 Tax=Saccharothrix sp. ST-888 TaxID=1427391 RepID=UPI000698810A|nr:serine hydrolase domain-containing protein [Saccharothrix sp. ST-888]